MERIGTIETACRYPVKSMAGEDMAEMFVGFSGVMGDRAYAFRPTEGATRGFPWHTGREQASLLLYRPRYLAPEAAALPVHVEESFGMAPGISPVFPAADAFAVEVTTPDGASWPVDAPELAADVAERAGRAVELRFSERSLYDCRPVSLFGNATARGLADELGQRIDRRRFRANLYADWTDDQPFREDALVGQRLQVGDRLRLAVLERDPRCKMITLDPQTGAAEPKILRQVAQRHGGHAGVYAAVLIEGVVRQGDPIWLV